MTTKNNMARTKGAKNKKPPIVRIHRGRNSISYIKRITPIAPDAENRILDVEAMIAQDKLPKVAKWAEGDRTYLRNLFQIFKGNIEPMIPEGFPEDANGNYLYTPAQMWRGMSAFIEFSILSGAPITISGIAVFSGMRPRTLLAMRASETLHPAYHFLRVVSDFAEMYNEFAVHKKINPAGAIFILKNMGWKDKFEIEATANGGSLTEEERREAQKRIQGFSE